MTQIHSYLAVDVSKDTLQIKNDVQDTVVGNDPAGFRKIIALSGRMTNPVVVFEASGCYERRLLEALRDAKVPCRLVNPKLIRAFALSEGIKAKTDPLDTDAIFRFAQEKRLQPAAPPTAQQRELMDLLDRRGQLCELVAREKNRLEKASRVVASSIKKVITFAEKEIASVEKQLRQLFKKDAALQTAFEALIKVQGVGEVTAWTVLTYLSEITTLERNRLVALAGLAPFNRDSGKMKGKRSIFGGRAKVRRVLYMAAHTAAIHNPVIKPYVQRLRERGKPYKSAIVAAMRKLLLHLQSLLKQLNPIPLAQ